MKKWTKVVSALTFAAVVSLPISTYAQIDASTPKVEANVLDTDIKSKYILEADAKAKGTDIEINAELKGASIVESTVLNDLIVWEILDEEGNVIQTEKTSTVKLQATVKDLKPGIKYCFDIRLKGKVNEDLLNTDLKLLGQKGFVCATTENPETPEGPEGPGGNGGTDDPKQPTPKNPKEEDQSTDDTIKPENPKNDDNAETTNPKSEDTSATSENEEQGGFFNWLFGLFR